VDPNVDDIHGIAIMSSFDLVLVSAVIFSSVGNFSFCGAVEPMHKTNCGRIPTILSIVLRYNLRTLLASALYTLKTVSKNQVHVVSNKPVDI
jgi:hypothetical protein